MKKLSLQSIIKENKDINPKEVQKKVEELVSKYGPGHAWELAFAWTEGDIPFRSPEYNFWEAVHQETAKQHNFKF